MEHKVLNRTSQFIYLFFLCDKLQTKSDYSSAL